MKKILTLVLFAAVTVAAQAQIDFGVKGGLNVTHLSVSKDVINPSNQMGFFIGPTVKFTLPIVGLGIDASALYDQRSANLKGADVKVKEKSIQIPVNARFSFGLGSTASIFIFAGPQFGFCLGDKVTKFFNDAAEWRLKSSNLSGNVGAGVMVLKHLQASINYNFALGRTGDFKVLDAGASVLGYNGTEIDGRMNAWQLSVAYFF